MISQDFFMRKLVFIFAVALFFSGCSTSKTILKTYKVEITHSINIVAMSPGGGLLAKAILEELANRGFTLVDAATVSSLSKSNLRKIDAHIILETITGFDGNPDNAGVTLKSAKTGQRIAGVLWKNGSGGATSSRADKFMRKNAIEAAEEITEALFKEIPSPSTSYAEITQEPESLSLSKKPLSPSASLGTTARPRRHRVPVQFQRLHHN